MNSFTTDDDFEESTRFDHESHRRLQRSIERDSAANRLSASGSRLSLAIDETQKIIREAKEARTPRTPRGEKFSAKLKRPRDQPGLLLELMHSYEEIRMAYSKATIVDKYEMGERLDKELHPKVEEFFKDMHTGYEILSHMTFH